MKTYALIVSMLLCLSIMYSNMLNRYYISRLEQEKAKSLYLKDSVLLQNQIILQQQIDKTAKSLIRLENQLSTYD